MNKEKKLMSIAVIFSLFIFSSAYLITEKTKDLRNEVDKQIQKNNELKIKNAKLQSKIEVLRSQKEKVKIIKQKDLRVGIYTPHLRRITRATIDYLDFKGKKDWERLVLLTIAAESDCGHYLKQIRGPARGITQTEPPTEEDVLLFYKSKMPQTYDKIKDLRMNAKLGIHESEVNLSYSIAICIGEYLRRGYRPYGASTEELARAWKMNYNTVLGRGSVQKALAKAKKFNVITD